MDRKSDLIDDDVLEIYDLIWSQSKEDRELVMELYRDLKALVAGNPERYAVSGDTLAKYAELLTKQTAQLVDLLKILHKNKQQDSALTDEEMDKIKKSIDGNE